MKKIIQIGIANAQDDALSFMRKNYENYYIYLIEPNIHSNSLIEEAYRFTKNKEIHNFAVGTENGKIDIYFHHYEEGNSQQASIIKEQLLAHTHKEENLTKINIECYTISKIIEELFDLQNEEIEYIIIDTEGTDCDLVLSTNFSKYNIKNVVFEYGHSDGPFSKGGPKYNKAIEHLQNLGYEYNQFDFFFNPTDCNVCFTRKG